MAPPPPCVEPTSVDGRGFACADPAGRSIHWGDARGLGSSSPSSAGARAAAAAPYVCFGDGLRYIRLARASELNELSSHVAGIEERVAASLTEAEAALGRREARWAAEAERRLSQSLREAVPQSPRPSVLLDPSVGRRLACVEEEMKGLRAAVREAGATAAACASSEDLVTLRTKLEEFRATADERVVHMDQDLREILRAQEAFVGQLTQEVRGFDAERERISLSASQRLTEQEARIVQLIQESNDASERRLLSLEAASKRAADEATATSAVIAELKDLCAMSSVRRATTNEPFRVLGDSPAGGARLGRIEQDGREFFAVAGQDPSAGGQRDRDLASLDAALTLRVAKQEQRMTQLAQETSAATAQRFVEQESRRRAQEAEMKLQLDKVRHELLSLQMGGQRTYAAPVFRKEPDQAA